MAFGEFLTGFLGSYQQVQQQRFQNQLLERRQAQEEQQFDRQMKLADLKMQQEERAQQQEEKRYAQQQERQSRLDELSLQEKKYEAGVEAQKRTQGMAVKKKELQLEESRNMTDRRRIMMGEQQDRTQNAIRGMEALSRMRGAYDKDVKGAYELQQKKDLAEQWGIPTPDVDAELQQHLQGMMGRRAQIAELENGIYGTLQGMGAGQGATAEQIPVKPWQEAYGGGGIPGGGEAPPAEPEQQGPPPPEGETAPAEPQAAAPTPAQPQQAPQQTAERYPGERWMQGRPQPATRQEAAKQEAEMNAVFKKLGRPETAYIESLEDKEKGRTAEVADLKNESNKVNRFLAMGADSQDVQLGEKVDEDGKPTGELALFGGRNRTATDVVDAADSALDKNGFKKRLGIGKAIETYSEFATPHPALGRIYDEYVVAPIVSEARKKATVVDGESVIQVDPFDMLGQTEGGRVSEIGMQAIDKAQFLQNRFGIQVVPVPPRVEQIDLPAPAVLDRVEDEIFGGGGTSPSAVLRKMDEVLKPDLENGQFSPESQQKIQNLVNRATQAVEAAKSTKPGFAQFAEEAAREREGGPSQQDLRKGPDQGQVRTAENVLQALQNTQRKMTNYTQRQQMIQPGNLRSPELRKFGGLLEKLQGSQEAPKPGKPVGQASGGIPGMAGKVATAGMMLSLGAMPGGEQAPAKQQAPPTPKAETPPAKEPVAPPEPTEFVKTLGSIGANTKDKNTVAQAAVGTLKGEYNKMKPEEKTAAQKSWQGTRAAWQNLGVKPGILMDLNEAVGLDRMDGLEKEAEKKLKEEEEKASAKAKAAKTEAEKKIVRDKAAADKKLREDRAKAREKAKGLPQGKG